MRLSAGEKMEGIRLVEGSDLSVRSQFNSKFAVVFSYVGKGDCRNLAGVAVMKRVPNRADQLKGAWTQFLDSKEFRGGTVACEKKR